MSTQFWKVMTMRKDKPLVVSRVGSGWTLPSGDIRIELYALPLDGMILLVPNDGGGQ